ncbi:MAG: leucine-rich repeat domain-containing protein [bacterium]
MQKAKMGLGLLSAVCAAALSLAQMGTPFAEMYPETRFLTPADGGTILNVVSQAQATASASAAAVAASAAGATGVVVLASANGTLCLSGGVWRLEWQQAAGASSEVVRIAVTNALAIQAASAVATAGAALGAYSNAVSNAVAKAGTALQPSSTNGWTVSAHSDWLLNPYTDGTNFLFKVAPAGTSWAPKDNPSYVPTGSLTVIWYYGSAATVKIPPTYAGQSVVSILEQAFYGPSTIIVPDGVTSIGNQAFAYSPQITNVTISSSVSLIDAWAFLGCTGLRSITIPASVTTISTQAFQNCTNLASVYFQGACPTVATNAFQGATNVVYYLAGYTFGTNVGGRATAIYGPSLATGVAINGASYAPDARGVVQLPTLTTPAQATNIANSVCAHMTTNNAAVGGAVIWNAASNAWFRVVCSTNMAFYVEAYP